ncbi:MAG: DICT sensory domain-containing protein [Roseiflexaceae bacterium]
MSIIPTIPDTYFAKSSAAIVPIERLSFVDSLDKNKFRLQSRQTMIALSHVIEEHAATGGPDTVLIAAFQRLSLFAVEASRYRLLAPQFAQVYVIGVPDVPFVDMPNVTAVPLDSAWPLVQEWSVIASGPRISVALFARDLEGFRHETRSRSFEGLFTTEVAVVDAAVARLRDALALPARSFERDRQATFRNQMLIKQALATRLQSRTTR